LKKYLVIIFLLIFCIILLNYFGLKEKREITIYLYDSKTLKLVPLKKEIKITKWQELIRKEDIIKEAILTLLRTSKENNLLSPIPKGTRLLNLSIKNNIAYVSFSKELKNNHPGGSIGEILTVYSIVNTITEFPDIKKVQILIDGAILETLVGHLDISEPLERDLSLIK
jgi:spore germination protein GerM